MTNNELTRESRGILREVGPHFRRLDALLGQPQERALHDEVMTVRDSEKTFSFLDDLRQLIVQSGGNLEAMLNGVVRLLPAAWRYPEVCCARVLVRDWTFATPGWQESPWTMASQIRVNGERVGTLEIAYVEARPIADYGPFTSDERVLLDFMSALLDKTVERLNAIEQLTHAVRQLELERAALEQANATLHSVLSRIEEERDEVRRSIAGNVDKVIMPIVRELQGRAVPGQKGVIDLLKKSMEEISSPFVDRLARSFASLTPLEISICRLIRDGLSSKEIARIRGVSPSTVARQRESIRHKLGIVRSDANLATYLRTLPD